MNTDMLKRSIVSALLSLLLSALILAAFSLLALRADDPDAILPALSIAALALSFVSCGLVVGAMGNRGVCALVATLIFSVVQGLASVLLGEGGKLPGIGRFAVIVAASIVSFVISSLIPEKKRRRAHGRRPGGTKGRSSSFVHGRGR